MHNKYVFSVKNNAAVNDIQHKYLKLSPWSTDLENWHEYNFYLRHIFCLILELEFYFMQTVHV